MFTLLYRYQVCNRTVLSSNIYFKVQRGVLNNVDYSSDEDETNAPVSDKTREDQNSYLLMKFMELLYSKFNSCEVQENRQFSISVRNLRSSFLQYLKSQNVISQFVDKLTKRMSKFKELVLAFDHKNVTFVDDMVNIFITSDLVELFEASNRKLYAGE